LLPLGGSSFSLYFFSSPHLAWFGRKPLAFRQPKLFDTSRFLFQDFSEDVWL
jgi:hypothetical protein